MFFENTLKCLLTLCLLSAIIGKVGGAVNHPRQTIFYGNGRYHRNNINVTPGTLN